MNWLEPFGYVAAAIFFGSLLNMIRLALYRAPDPARFINWYVLFASLIGLMAIGQAHKLGTSIEIGPLAAGVVVASPLLALVGTVVDRWSWWTLPDLRPESRWKAR